MFNGFVFLFLFASSITNSFGKELVCIDAEDIFVGRSKKSKAYFKTKLFSKVTSNKLADDQLIMAMINKNPDLMFYQNELKYLEINNQLDSFRVMEILSLERNFTPPTFSTYTAQVKYRVKGQVKTREAYFRTNNEVLVPYPEQRLKRPSRKDYITYRNIHGNIEHKDLTLAVLETMDDFPKFSRGMNEIELNLWKKFNR